MSRLAAAGKTSSWPPGSQPTRRLSFLWPARPSGSRQNVFPSAGGTKTAARAAYEKSHEFKKGQRFRVGIEGRISVLFRGRGIKRCPLHRRARFEIVGGAAVLANNLLDIAAQLQRRAARQPHAA